MAAFKGLLVKLSAICILSSLMFTSQSDCFSTTRAREPVRSSMRSNNFDAEPEYGTMSKENAYLANYITAIEQESSDDGERGFMVATTDHNYAIYSPALKSQGWLILAVNGDNVFLVTTKNTTLSTSLYGLEEQQRDFIAELRGNFTQNLAGLKFAHYTSGSSTYFTKPFGPSVASMAIGQLQYNNPASLPPPGPQGAASPAYVQIDSPAAAPTPLDRSSETGLLQPNALPPSAEAFFGRSLGKNKRSFGGSRANGRLMWRARNGANPSADIYNGLGENQYQLPGARPIGFDKSADVSKSLCSGRFNNNFNYYNLLQEPLNDTLDGDVYYFDLHCNILDVYSASVSVRQAQRISALYRDANYFSYARSGMPLAINRFFLSDDQVFFVYNDGSLIVKMDWMLDQTELDVVIEARQQLKLIGNWQSLAADLLSKSANMKNSSTA